MRMECIHASTNQGGHVLLSESLTIYGHAYDRKLLLNDLGSYKVLSMPAGAYLLALLFGIDQTTANIPATENIQITTSGDCYLFGESLGFSGVVAETMIGNGENVVVFDEGYGISDKIPLGKRILWSSEKCLPDNEIFSKIKHQTFLMIDADVLRSNGALISKQVSWERTATDLLWQLKNNPKFSYLLGSTNIFVVFGDEAGVIMRGDQTDFSAHLMFFSGKPEGSLSIEYPSKIPDLWALKTAFTIRTWLKTNDMLSAEFLSSDFNPIGNLRETGYSIKSISNADFTDWTNWSSPLSIFSNKIPNPTDRMVADPDYWCVIQGEDRVKLYDLAINYVKNGNKVLKGLPRFSCGSLTTVDRREIEAFQNIKNLITEYVDKKNPKSPLSIAVFGAPGSGKSFGVKQIAKTLNKDLIVSIEINVSQITDAADLSAAFHQVRDIVLMGKLPLVFFDEFDSDGLKWLQSFLAPMQDGEFKDESGVHPIGKAIFVFAGGTAFSFEDFISPINQRYEIIRQNGHDEQTTIRKRKKDAEKESYFKRVKAPDFVSRLRGTINILGPNQTSNSDEQGFILRRAILLRSYLEQKGLISKKGKAQVSDDILRAMLLITKYEHGARSMEAILDMSRIEGTSFEPVSLPFYTQMNLHVDADAFIRLVLTDTILNGYLEDLAEAIHNDHLLKSEERNEHVDKEGKKSWDKLSEDLKDQYREQARAISRKLKSVDCAYDLGDAPYRTVDAFTREEIKRMAKLEHNDWIDSRKNDGWTYSEVQDDDNKRHPLMVSFDDLPDVEKKRAIDVMGNIIPLINSVGLRVYRML
ncbi:MAG: RyR domain-containing protein [Coriobacteriia bacterium]|nr:RyR domain-containing protein [Coriobacteriia bacterium]